jgi:hypothetical protein
MHNEGVKVRMEIGEILLPVHPDFAGIEIGDLGWIRYRGVGPKPRVPLSRRNAAPFELEFRFDAE